MSIHNIPKNTTNNTGNVLRVKDYPYKTYISNNFKSQIAFAENNIFKRYDNITFNNTNNICKHVNQYPTDVFLITIRQIKHIMQRSHSICLSTVLLFINLTTETLMILTM